MVFSVLCCRGLLLGLPIEDIFSWRDAHPKKVWAAVGELPSQCMVGRDSFPKNPCPNLHPTQQRRWQMPKRLWRNSPRPLSQLQCFFLCYQVFLVIWKLNQNQKPSTILSSSLCTAPPPIVSIFPNSLGGIGIGNNKKEAH